METEKSETTPKAENDKPGGNNVTAETVNVEKSGVQTLNATSAVLRQAGVQNANTERLMVRQGGIVKAKAESVEMLQAGAGLVQTNTAHLTASNSVAVVAGSSVVMDQAAARVLVAGGNVDMDQGGAGLVVTQNARLNNSAVVFLISRNVEGDVKPMFGPQESMIFGAAAGLVAGVIALIGGLVRRRKGKH